MISIPPERDEKFARRNYNQSEEESGSKKLEIRSRKMEELDK
jgi:hypothetical protein